MEKSIKELPLPEKVKAIAIYKRYREIKKIEEEMDKATREIEKKYLKLDEPVLTNVSTTPPRSLISLEERELSSKRKSKNPRNISLRRRSRKSPTT